MRRGALAAVSGAFALAVAGWGYVNFERVPAREFVGFSGEAARNPLLALERLAQRMGATTGVVRRAADLESTPPGATLVLARGRHGLSATRMGRLLSWVERGGHLIVEAEAPEDRDALLDALGILHRAVHPPAGVARIALPGGAPPFEVALPALELIDVKRRPGYTARHGAGAALLHFDLREGQVTVLPSFAFMTNGAIGEHDHAAFAWALIEAAPRTKSVLFAPRFERPSLTAWLAGEARAALASVTVLLLLWLWRIGRRFGPVQPPARPERRRLLDHLRAAGRFLWASQAAPRLLEAAREACLAKVGRGPHGLANLPARERCARCAELTGIPIEEIDFAFNGRARSARAFTAAVGTLQLIEEKLTRTVGA